MLKYTFILLFFATVALAYKISFGEEHHAPHQTGFGRKNEKKSRAFPSTTTSDSSHTFGSPPEASQPVGPNVPNKEGAHLLKAYQKLKGTARTMQSVGTCFGSNPPDCPQPEVDMYRTIDGTCNNINKPFQGATNTPYSRLLPARYEDEADNPPGHEQATNTGGSGPGPFDPPLPSARLVSEVIALDIHSPHPSLNHMFMQWGQWITHDMTAGTGAGSCSGCEFVEGVCEPILVPANDPEFDGACIGFTRLAACTNPNGGVRDQINILTTYLDASVVYGSSRMVEEELRSFQDGLLIEGDPVASGGKATLPLVTLAQRLSGVVFCGPGPCFLAGQRSANQHALLITMHTIWLREHNRIARRLGEINSQWDDEMVYQETRKIIGAMTEKITYFDYLPKLLGQPAFDQMIGQYGGFKPNVDPSILNSFTTSAFRHAHSNVRNPFDRLGPGYVEEDPIDFADTFLSHAAFVESGGTDKFLRGLLTQAMEDTDEFMTSALTSSFPFELIAIDIQRQRDTGLQPYVRFRDFCRNHFPMLGNSDIQNDLTLSRLLDLYGSLDNVDLWVGGVAEDKMGGATVGRTFACIIALNFARLRDGDAFYFERDGVFSSEQRNEILKASLSRVVCDNADDIDTVPTDAFLSNQARVPCSQIPSIDLEQWKVEPPPTMCHIKIEQDGSLGGAGVTLHQQSDLGESFVSTGQFSRFRSPLCLPMQCPLSTTGETVSISLSNPFQAVFCSAQSSPALPRDEAIFGGKYVSSSFTSSLVDSGSGVHSSLSQCTSANSATAIIFSC